MRGTGHPLDVGPVHVLTPTGRDAEGARRLLESAGIRVTVTPSLAELCQVLGAGEEADTLLGAVLVAEEALVGRNLQHLATSLAAQPPWSDLPFVVLTYGTAASRRTLPDLHLPEALGNVMFLERPLNALTLVSVVRTALRARRRQLQVREHLHRVEVAAEALRESEANLQTALRAGRLGSWSLELPTMDLTASAALKASFGLGEAEPFSYADLVAAVHPDDRKRRAGAFKRAIGGGTDYDVEHRVIWPDGSVHWIEARGRTVYAPGTGEPLRMIGVTLDVTERHRAAEELRRLNETLEKRVEERTAELVRAQAALSQAQKMEAVGQLTGGIAHDFNNLLTAVVGGLDLIRHRANDERTKRLAENALQAAERGSKLTAQLLAFSRRQRLALTAVDVNKTIPAMGELLSSSVGTVARISFALDPDAGAALTDANQFELAVLNLAINARDALQAQAARSPGGVITIGTGRRRLVESEMVGLAAGDYVVVSVADNGPGMEPEVVDRAFDPFFTTKPLGQGTGLGLSQVYGLARQSEGTAVIDSELGRGTTVRLVLPRTEIVAEQPNTTEDENALPATVDGGRQATVLVVDDDPNARRVFVEALERLGYQVRAAGDAASGLDELRARQPDMALFDFAMPGMNGAELSRIARKLQPDLPIAIITGYADTDALEATAAVDHIPVLRKPFRPAELARTIRTMLERTAGTPAGPPNDRSASLQRTGTPHP